MNVFEKQVRGHFLALSLITILVSCFLTQATTQTNDSFHISLQSVYPSNNLQGLQYTYPQSIVKSKGESNRSIMLPTLNSMDQDYPLFCRLEDKINAGNKLQCLFRLGSLSYVNFLEQKGDHQKLMLEQIR